MGSLGDFRTMLRQTVLTTEIGVCVWRKSTEMLRLAGRSADVCSVVRRCAGWHASGHPAEALNVLRLALHVWSRCTPMTSTRQSRYRPRQRISTATMFSAPTRARTWDLRIKSVRDLGFY
jgi:hypothetical protein